MSNQNYLGIDVSKNELVIFDSSTREILTIDNSLVALEKNLRQHDWKNSKYIVGLESTGDYSYLAMKFFVEAGFVVKLLNPIVTKKFTNATIRKKKTDIADAQVIADLLQYGEGQIVTDKDLNLEKKALLRLEQKLTKMKAGLLRMSHSLELKEKNGIQLNQARQQIQDLIDEVEKTSKNIFQQTKSAASDRQEEIIASHVGCGEKLSSIISAEAGDIKRFPSAKQLKAYAGIDPRIIQSGQKDVKGKMTKRGNSTLRHALFLAAFVASQRDPELREYYQKKRSEGKSHKHAVCTIARKMCERIYATVVQNRLYTVKSD